MPTLTGLHHVTAISGPAQPNVDFYTGFLGLRLVKRTVNFDDPGTYHLYYGDERGSPGSILTFFPWAGASRGRVGAGQISITSFAVPQDSLPGWRERAIRAEVQHEASQTIFGERTLTVTDPDGMLIRLVEVPSAARIPVWPGSPVPEYAAIQSLHGVSLMEVDALLTERLLTRDLGFRTLGIEGRRRRYQIGTHMVDILDEPGSRRGMQGAGSVHHVAFSTPSSEGQCEWRDRLLGLGHGVSSVMDRIYFTSIYFREPGGVLFEIATAGPGFATDETAESLGTRLMLPSWLEAERQTIEASLPKLHLGIPAKA